MSQKLMIATPAHDGRLDHTYVLSLLKTIGAATEAGIAVNWFVCTYNADIVSARADLLSTFLEGDFTHILYVDSDMGWEPQALQRCFGARRDFVAVAGCRKKYPLQFAMVNVAPDGTPLELNFNNETGTAVVTEVGFGFVLLTKEMVLRMVEAYPELTHVNQGGRTIHSLFHPMIEDGRYWSEDYSFCRRWRKLGGEVHVCPDIALKHVGFHTFEGAIGRLTELPKAAE